MKRTFKEFESMWEDAAANSVSGGGVSMPADMMPKAAHKKHKKKVYDGRTKEGKAFIRRILDKRNKRMLKGQSEIDEGRYNSKTDTYEFDENDFRYYRTGELKLRNGAYGRDVEKAFKKAGYDVYGRDVSIKRDEIRFNKYSKHWGTDDKKLRKVVMDVLNIDINKL
mgnify:CR=1 FL=1